MNLNLAVLAGDGIGPEVIDQAIKVVDAIGKKYGHTINYTYAITGAVAIDEVGNPYP
ncbi:MAG: 3-isopropylmalate dehydrogenase, partial [Spirosomataceae bacterium]